jgi:hypothetical protein
MARRANSGGNRLVERTAVAELQRMTRRAKSGRQRLVERRAVAELQRGMAKRAKISKLNEERLEEPRPAEENGKKSQKS